MPSEKSNRSKEVAQAVSDSFYDGLPSSDDGTSGGGSDGGARGGEDGIALPPVAEEKSEAYSGGGHVETKGFSPPNAKAREDVVRGLGKRKATQLNQATVRSTEQFTGTSLADFPSWMDLDISEESDGGIEDRYFLPVILRDLSSSDDDEEEDGSNDEVFGSDDEVLEVSPPTRQPRGSRMLTRAGSSAADTKRSKDTGKSVAAKPTATSASAKAAGSAAGSAADSAAGTKRGRGRPKGSKKNSAPKSTAATAAKIDLSANEVDVLAAAQPAPGSANNPTKRTTGSAGGEGAPVAGEKAKITAAATPAAVGEAETAAATAAATATATAEATAAAMAAAAVATTAEDAPKETLVATATLAAIVAAKAAGMDPQVATAIAKIAGPEAVAGGYAASSTKGKGGAKKPSQNAAQQRKAMAKAKIKEPKEERERRQAAAATTSAASRAANVEDDGGDEGDGGQEGHGGEEGHGDDPPLERYAAAVDALRPDGYTKVRYKTVSIDAMRHWKTCYDELRRTRTRARSQLTAIMDGSSSRRKGADGEAADFKI
eukprot:g16062.t1